MEFKALGRNSTTAKNDSLPSTRQAVSSEAPGFKRAEVRLDMVLNVGL